MSAGASAQAQGRGSATLAVKGPVTFRLRAQGGSDVVVQGESRVGATGVLDVTDVDDFRDSAAQLQPRLGEPDGLDVGADEVLVGEVEARRGDGSRDHALGWGRFTNSRLQVHIRQGAHFAVVEDVAFIHGVINRELSGVVG